MFDYATQHERKTRILRSLAYVFQKTDRILSSRDDLKCVVVEEPHSRFPAWTDGDTVSFNIPFIKSVDTPEGITQFAGANYHELGHVMFSPCLRGAGRLQMWIRREAINQMAYNILEDQRVESFMAAKFPSLMHYYTSMCEAYILTKDADMANVWLFVHGRRYLGSKVRGLAKKLFAKQDLVSEYEALIDRYRVLDLYQSSDLDIAYPILDRFAELLGSSQDAVQYKHPNCNQAHGSSTTPSDVEAASEAKVKVEEGADDRDNQPGSGDSQEGDQDGDSADDAASGEAGVGTPTDGAGDVEASSSAGGSSQTNAKDAGKLRDAIQEIVDAVLNDEVVAGEVESAQRNIRAGTSGEAIDSKVNFGSRSMAHVVGAARKFESKLRRIVEEQDPGWERYQSGGKLNISRYVHGDDLDTVFDSWNEGHNDAASIEGVLLVDTSSSMDDLGEALSEQCWLIKRGFDALKAPLTVYAYDTSTFAVYTAKDRAKPDYVPRLTPKGGTRPNEALMEAWRRLTSSKCKKRVLIVMTDGVWAPETNAPYENDELIEKMNKAGVLTALAYYSHGRSVQNANWHNAMVRVHIKDLNDLNVLSHEIVKRLIKMR